MVYLKDKDAVIQIKVPQATKEEVRKQAEELGTTISALVRDVITDYFINK